jgi:hypothetical protein
MDSRSIGKEAEQFNSQENTNHLSAFMMVNVPFIALVCNNQSFCKIYLSFEVLITV